MRKQIVNRQHDLRTALAQNPETRNQAGFAISALAGIDMNHIGGRENRKRTVSAHRSGLLRSYQCSARARRGMAKLSHYVEQSGVNFIPRPVKQSGSR